MTIKTIQKFCTNAAKVAENVFPKKNYSISATTPLSHELEEKAKMLAKKMGVVSHVRFGVNPTLEGSGGCCRGSNFSWGRPIVLIDKEDSNSIGTIAHELGHLSNHDFDKNRALKFLNLGLVGVGLASGLDSSQILVNVLCARVAINAFSRRQEKQADLKAAAFLEIKDQARFIHEFHRDGDSTDIHCEANQNAPWYLKWSSQIGALPIYDHPSSALRVRYLLPIYEQKNENPSLKVILNNGQTTIELPKNTMEMIKNKIRENSRYPMLFDVHSIRITDQERDNVIMETTDDLCESTVPKQTIQAYLDAVQNQPEIAHEKLMEVVIASLSDPLKIVFEISRAELNDFKTFEEQKNYIKTGMADKLPNNLDWNTMTIKESKDLGMFLIKISYEKENPTC